MQPPNVSACITAADGSGAEIVAAAPRSGDRTNPAARKRRNAMRRKVTSYGTPSNRSISFVIIVIALE
jgi:hypothetical protein